MSESKRERARVLCQMGCSTGLPEREDCIEKEKIVAEVVIVAVGGRSVIMGQRRPPDAILQVREVRCIHSLNATHAAIMLGEMRAILSGARHFASPYSTCRPGRLARLITLRARRF